MPTLALVAALALQIEGSSPLAQLPVAPPSSDATFAAVVDFDGDGPPQIVVRTDAGLALATWSGGALDLCPASPIDPGIAIERSGAFDFECDGSMSLWAPAGAELVEILLGTDGRLAIGARLSLPGRAVRFVAGAALELELAGGAPALVEVVMRDGSPAITPLWSGATRGVARLQDTDWLIVDGSGSPWLVCERGALGFDTEQAIQTVVSSGGTTLVQFEGGALASVEDVSADTVSNGARATWRRLSVEGTALDLMGARLFDVDGDGDLDLVKVTAAGIELRMAWGRTGFFAPRLAPRFGAPVGPDWLGLAEIDGQATLLAPRALVPLCGAATLEEATLLLAGRLAARDLDGDGDVDLAALGSIARNDASGSFCVEWLFHDATAQLALTRGHLVDFVGVGGGRVQFVEARPDGSYAAAVELDGLPADIDWNTAVAGDLDGDGNDEWIASGHVFKRRVDDVNWRVFAEAPSGVIALADFDRDGRAEALVLNGPRGTLETAAFEGGGFGVLTPLAALGRAVERADVIDLDADGDLDLVLADGPRVTLLVQGFGAWLESATFDVPLDQITSVVGADLCGDGSVALLFGGGDGRSALVSFDALNGSSVAFDVRWCCEHSCFADLDGDGDLDYVAQDGGFATIDGAQWSGVQAGAVVQYGAGLPGSGGLTPLLGVHGPVRHSATPGEVRLLGAVGGTQAFLAVTPDDWVLDLRRFGITVAESPASLRWLNSGLDGRLGAPGQGTWTMQLGFDASLVGTTLRAQAFVVDPCAIDSVSVSNRIAVTFGR